MGLSGLLCGPMYTMRAYLIDIVCVGRPTSIKWANKRESLMFYIRKIQILLNYRGLWGFGPFRATVWAHVQDKVAVSVIFSNPNIH